ncbi:MULTISPECIES: hypothetical protein [Pseudomonas]|uniref:Uncharacterized protein n=1 Tax=Pseudomonas fluorescens TaxID=294 RepID=A0A166R4D3_PSEFL|nr:MULTISPECIES: hypothetical protein [Pseudomonas]KZN21287.1 hypothetical protein A1D17_02330 [Pseudomonas fluorescens]
MSKNPKQSSAKVAKLASDTLRNPKASITAKELAGSVLAQASTRKQTGEDMEAKAGMVLASEKYSADTKALAASLVSQSNQARGE